MEAFTEFIKGIWNEWLLSHIKGIVVSWAIITFVTAVSYGFFGNADIASIYYKWSMFMNYVWVADTLLFVAAGIDWLIH